jgi:hypothetical protein
MRINENNSFIPFSPFFFGFFYVMFIKLSNSRANVSDFADIKIPLPDNFKSEQTVIEKCSVSAY